MTTVNITMLTHGRPRLTEQALRTLSQNTSPLSFRLTTHDDEGKEGTGGARNRVIRIAEEGSMSQKGGRLDFLYLSDNDVAFLPGWLETLIDAYEYGARELKLAALGGYCHPFHIPTEEHIYPYRARGGVAGRLIGLTWALPTQSMLITWDTWDRFGPFVETPPGKIRQSEDWNFTERLRAAGLRVGALYPPVVLPTARHDTFGELVPEHDFIKDIPGLIVE